MNRLFMCNGCRQKKQIVLNSCGMSYCEGCKHKAPKSKKEFNDFKDANKIDYSFGERNRMSTNSRVIKEIQRETRGEE